ncbi:phosphatase [Actinoplanes sp. SE50]|uniref:HAD family hydrolase n=1 Tax=unclassified Actinoplanes TaxID=2626549 RepID=UPI00023EBBF6|nr:MULTISPECIES: HAD family phosphatase [unclassified Actinoplanes]AEV86237.1 Phosphoglycolate phosphatase [Actinoplanes sp. SE50/110]ATO84635.1 phosphatase [Actinoplanes sp. SE50]SLM02045.1 phosphatase [Actinoplanes sp. SE50/110]
MAIEALIFDFDGLLMDTETTLLDSWRWEWRQHGLRLDESGFFADHGGDTSEIRYAALAAAVGPGFDRSASHARRTAYRERAHAALGLATGISAWLAEAERRGLRLAVASSSAGAWVRTNLARTGDLPRFEVLACGDEVPADKPDPAVYHLALHRLGLTADRAVAFEDSPHGVTAARAAGLRCVAIPNPHTPHARYRHADTLLPSAATTILSEVLARLA